PFMTLNCRSNHFPIKQLGNDGGAVLLRHPQRFNPSSSKCFVEDPGESWRC
ncbi:MAG: hypothetical protein ACJAT7_003380, partial [Psychromonas sp.]